MRLVGAGVVCYAHDPATDDTYLLLGKEKETPGWRMGSNKWSGFSGKAESLEHIHLTAAREFLEESLCAVSLSDDDGDASAGVFSTPSQIEDILRKSLPIENIVQGRSNLCKHITFLTSVRFNNYPEVFRRYRSELLAMDAVFHHFPPPQETLLGHNIEAPSPGLHPLVTPHGKGREDTKRQGSRNGAVVQPRFFAELPCLCA